MSTASERGWGYPGAPGSTAERAYRALFIKTIEVGGVRLAVRRQVAHLFEGFINELLATGYRLDVNADDWGFANRDVRGAPGVKSNHAWGLAVDLNAIDNPMTTSHPDHAGDSGHDGRGVHTDMPPGTNRLAEKWGLRWGANYSGSRADAMHFEFMGTPNDVKKYPLTVTPQEVTAMFPTHRFVRIPGDAMKFYSWDPSDSTVYAWNGAPGPILSAQGQAKARAEGGIRDLSYVPGVGLSAVVGNPGQSATWPVWNFKDLGAEDRA